MLNQLTISELTAKLAKREVSSREVMQSCLDRIARVDGKIHAFISHDAADALRQADAADQLLSQGGGANRPLLGVPVAVKDVLAVKNQPLNCGSKILGRFISPYDATVVEKLKEAGAIVFGRLNMDEFAMGSSTENSAFGVTRNPWDTTRIPGGSSGGSAAAVAADEVIAALGSDTGGSIRQPAALCGLVGLKPTYGRVSRYGLVAFASSLDQIGPFGWTVADAALLMNVISGRDPKDSTSVDEKVPDYLGELEKPIAGLRIGIVKEYELGSGVDPQVKAAVDAAIKTYQSLGAEIVPVSLPHTEYGIAAYYVIAPCEASSNLARYDGVHFGHRTSEPVKDIIELFSKSRAEGFGEEVQRRIMIGTYALSSGYYDAYYVRAQKVRALIKRDFDQAFEKCDVILCPTSPTPAFKAGEKTGDPLQMYLCDVFTVTCNIAGIAGLSMPCGFTSGNKPLPIGLQLLGPTFGEDRLLRIARMYEAATEWHKRRPALGT
jgi:aspartyl-tRNA(Asn)/glutamyl-tRNA(Gln) amidotransferase subunit A